MKEPRLFNNNSVSSFFINIYIKTHTTVVYFGRLHEDCVRNGAVEALLEKGPGNREREQNIHRYMCGFAMHLIATPQKTALLHGGD